MDNEALILMDHQQAKQLSAVEKYFLEELTPEVRDEFEEHFFDCDECAIDLRVTAGFVDAAKKEFKANPAKRPGPSGSSNVRSFFHWPAALAWSALAASLLVIAYQNVVVYPGLKTEIAALNTPEVLPSVSLVRGNSRGGQIAATAVGPNKPFLLLLDIPTEDRFASYTCLLYSPSGSLFWQMDVSAQQAKDTVSIRVPSAGRQPGVYMLTVKGTTPGGASVELGHYPFNLHAD